MRSSGTTPIRTPRWRRRSRGCGGWRRRAGFPPRMARKALTSASPSSRSTTWRPSRRAERRTRGRPQQTTFPTSPRAGSRSSSPRSTTSAGRRPTAAFVRQQDWLLAFRRRSRQTAGMPSEARTDAARLVGRLHAAMNARDIEAFVACFADDYDSVQPAHPDRAFRGREQVRANWSAVFTGVPDFRADLVRIDAVDDTVWSEWRWEGTQTD